MALTKVQNTGIADDAITTDKIENTTVVAADIAAGTVSADKLASTLDLSSKTVTLKNNEISNAELANSSLTINGSAISLGGSGSVKHIDWQAVTVADGSTTLSAVAGKGYFLDTNAGVIEVFLPSSPSRGDTIVFADYAGHFDQNRVIINTGGKNIDSTATGDVQVTTKDAIVELVYVDANKGWLVKMNQTAGATPSTAMGEGLSIYNEDNEFITATGGTITTVSTNFKVHTFTGDGTFAVSAGLGPKAIVDYLVVAGGGGGGDDDGGGGGGGGFREAKTGNNGSHTASPLATPTGIQITTGNYPITVGGGGAGGDPSTRNGSSGSNSVFSTITSAGGGFGARCAPNAGGSGGSGGAGAYSGAAGGAGNTPPVSPPQGRDGGAGTPGGNAGGGGGGAGAVGSAGSGSAPSGQAGSGGNGATTHIPGSPITKSGGGGGGAFGTKGGGGTGGGGAGGQYPTTAAQAGTANSGGGGGGGSTASAPTPRAGGAGGKGIVVIRYKFQ